MIKIIENPNPCREFVVTCDKCQCKFSFIISDVHKMDSPFGPTGFEPDVVDCPNCGNEIVKTNASIR